MAYGDENLWDPTQEAVGYLRRKGFEAPQVAIVLGSGLVVGGDQLGGTLAVPYADVPHFPTPTISGHPGELIYGEIAGVRCVVMRGRVFYLEGYSMQKVAFGVRVMAGLGAKTLLVTNAAGGINPEFEPGDMMVIGDHINLSGDNPLQGPNDERFGPRFPDMTNAYAPRLRDVWHKAARKLDMRLRDGTYVGLAGPSYETPAEIRMLHRLGIDAVGMSTVAEVIAARHVGMEVGGLSVISNRAAGLAGKPLDHNEVTELGARIRDRLSGLLVEAVRSLAAVGGV